MSTRRLDTNPDVIETVRAIADQLGYDEARFEATAIDEYAYRSTSRSTCSSRCTPATPRPTRRSQPASGSGPTRSSSRPAATTSWLHSFEGQIAGEKDALLRHGLLLGRQADLVTDALRASALEMLGYRVDVIEFVSPEHTAKNVMLRAEHAPSAARARRAEAEYVELRDRWEVDPAIERLLGDRLAVSQRR